MLSYLLFVFLLVIILATFIYTFSATSILKQNKFSLYQGFNQANAYLSYKLNNISSSSDMIIYNVDLNSILNKKIDTYPVMEQIADSKTISYFMKSIQESNDIKQARLYVPDELIYSDNGVNICSFSQAKSTSWWDSLFLKKGLHLFIGNDSLEDLPYGNQKCIALLRAMYSQKDYSKLAYILRLDVSLTEIETILRSADFTNDSLTLLLDKNNKLIATSSATSTQSFLNENSNIIDMPVFPFDEVTSISLDGLSFFALKTPVAETGWNMVTLVPNASFTLAITSLVKTIIIVSILMIILGFFLSHPIAYTITKRIDSLGTYMKQTKDGVLTEIPNAIYKDEIGILYENYNFMIGRIHTLLNENYKIGRELKSAEYNALQSQINPHFLYNTLDMIIWMLYQNKTEEINSVVYSLANFYKLSLNKGNYFVPLSDEIDHVGYYIKIQNLRFIDTFTFSVDVEPSLMQFSIPKITLQPIIENALYHGILEKESKSGSIILSGVPIGDDMDIIITDDGIGIPSEQLNALLQTYKEKVSEDSGSHYGLRNIDKRIKLQYGEKYGLSFESILGQGTTVHILLPTIYVDDVI